MSTEVATKAAAASVDGGIPPLLLWAALIAIVLARLVWFCQYMYLIRRNVKLGRTLVTSRLYEALNEAERQGVHEEVAAEVNRLVDTSLLVGAIAFAAWTALFAVAGQPPGAQVSSLSRSLLLIGAAILIAAPLLFRVPDYYLTFIGRRSALFVGLNAVGLAFASIANDLLRGPARIAVPLAVLIILAARDLSDTVGEIHLQTVTVGHALDSAKADTSDSRSQA